MATAKEVVAEMLEGLPDDTTLEDIQYHVYVLEKIERGLQAAEDGHVLSEQEVEQRLSR